MSGDRRPVTENRNRAAAARRWREKKLALAAIKQALATAESLYRKDAPRFKPLFALINLALKQKRKPALIVLVTGAIARREKVAPVGDVAEYFQGMLRKIEQEAQSKEIRASGATIGDILAPLLERHSRATGNPRGGKK